MKVSFLDAEGGRQNATLSPNIYQAAHDAGMTIDSYLASEYRTDEQRYGSTLSQMMASAGLFLHDDPKHGIRAAKVIDAMNGTFDSQYEARGTANTADAQPASWVLFPAAILQLVEASLYADRSSELALFDSMIAKKETVAGSRYIYPVIDYTRPSAARSSRSSQLAEPNVMMILTASDKQGTIPSFSLGLEISDEATKALTIDFVGMSLSRQAEVEAVARMDEAIYYMVNGDPDQGFSALPQTHVSVYDSTISTDGVITHTAWINYLAKNRRLRQIDKAFMTINTFLKLENRTGKPIVTTDSAKDPFQQRPNVIPSLLNLSLTGVGVMLVDATIVPEDTIVGFDSRYAMRKVTNSEANYKAAEQVVMRKGSAMRWDWGYAVHRLYDEAWDVLVLLH